MLGKTVNRLGSRRHRLAPGNRTDDHRIFGRLFAQAEHKKNCTELGTAVLKYLQGRSHRRLYGRVHCRTTPRTAGPHSKTNPDPVPWSTGCSSVRSPTLYAGESVSKQQNMGGGNAREASWTVGGWVGKDRKTA